MVARRRYCSSSRMPMARIVINLARGRQGPFRPSGCSFRGKGRGEGNQGGISCSTGSHSGRGRSNN